MLIIPQSVASKQFTLSASQLAVKDDQVVNAGQMLIKMADYEYPQKFDSYERVSKMSNIKPGFYRAIMRLAVTNFMLSHHYIIVMLDAKIYSYQGKLLYEKTFTGQAPFGKNLQMAALQAYRSAFKQINDRLQQVLYWEQHAGLTFVNTSSHA